MLSFIFHQATPARPEVRFRVQRICHPLADAPAHLTGNPQLFATLPPYLVWFCLDTTAHPRNNPPHLAASAAADLPACAATGESTCNICRDGPCNVLIRTAPLAATGYVPI